VVSFVQQARLLEEQITDETSLLRHVDASGGNGNGDGEAYELRLIEERPSEIVVRTIEAKSGLATTHHLRRSALDAHEYKRLAEVHHDLADLVGTPPFTIRLGENVRDAASFEELREEILAVAQRGIDYYRFKGLGEMDAEELRETTMDPTQRTLVQVTIEDAATADMTFSMLMGDQVEPRRAFIEENAKSVINLDV
jgi:DNA gyrase subunit B